MNDNIKFIYPENDVYMENIAFIRALFIKKYIESLNISTLNKKEIFNQILEFLKNN